MQNAKKKLWMVTLFKNDFRMTTILVFKKLLLYSKKSEKQRTWSLKICSHKKKYATKNSSWQFAFSRASHQTARAGVGRRFFLALISPQSALFTFRFLWCCGTFFADFLVSAKQQSALAPPCSSRPKFETFLQNHAVN